MREAKPVQFIPPQLATLVAEAPGGDDWLHEIKFDGYRAEIVIAQHRARVFTRSGADWTGKFRQIVDAALKLPCRSAVIDGEAVVLDEKGVSSFSKMQNAMGSGKGDPVIFYAFDLLQLDGMDLRKMPLTRRKEFLAALLSTHKGGSWIQYADHVAGNGATFFRSACEHNLEGIISKKANAPYRSGRSTSWFKVKCIKQQEFVVGGWQPRSDNPADIGSLLVGFFRDNKFEFAGRVGTGFSGKTRAKLLQTLKPHFRATDPFNESPREIRRTAKWVDPSLVVNVKFTEFTDDGLLRHPSFQGVRLDKKAKEVGLEAPRPTLEPGTIAKSRNRWRRRSNA